MTFFSIIIPTYDRAGFLKETIRSVQSQTFEDWECIVVDDGSTDDSASVVRTICESDPRVKYVYQINAERSAARNNGIRHSKGRYVCFLDSDDRYDPSYLVSLHSLLSGSNFPKVLVVTDLCLWDGMNAKPANTPPITRDISTWLFKYPVSPSRACVHADILKSFQFREDIVIVEDTVLWISIANEYPVVFNPNPLVWYRVHEDNSVNKATKACFDRYAGLKKFFSDPLSDIVPKKVKYEHLSDTLWKMAEYNVNHGSRCQALIQILHSILLTPIHRHTKAKVYLLVFGIVLMRKFR